MGDLIGRKTAIEAIKNYGKDAISAGRETLDPVDDIVDMVRVIDALPAVDAAPVVHGRWTWHEDEFSYECSACHCQFDYSCTFGMFDHGYEYASYCPNCNAKMDLEGET